MSRIHKRIYRAMEKGYLPSDIAQVLGAAACPGIAQSPWRRQYLVDPWGQPYWVKVIFDEEGATDVPSQPLPQSFGDHEAPQARWSSGTMEVPVGRVAVYSFGPNRRRDSAEGKFEGTDDIGFWADLTEGAASDEDDDESDIDF